MCLVKCTTFAQHMNLSKGIFQTNLTPIHQTVLILLVQALLCIAFLLLGVKGRNVWMIFQVPVLFYTCMNMMMGVFGKHKMLIYYPLSILGFATVFAVSYVFSEQISGDNIRVHSDFFNVLVLNGLFYFLFLMISVVYKGVVQFLESI